MQVKDFADREGITVQRAARLAREGRIPHARKVGAHWEIPDAATVERRGGRPLSQQSREDFLGFLNTGTLDHVTGIRKKRTASRVRQFLASGDPAKLLRDWWGSESPDGRGGAALVRAAQKGNDRQVRDARQGQVTWKLDSPDVIARRVSDYRAIQGMTIADVAEAAGVSDRTISSLERHGFSPTGNRDAARVASALHIPHIRIRTQKERHD